MSSPLTDPDVIGWVGVVTSGFLLVLATTVISVRPAAAINRLLALLLVAEAFGVGVEIDRLAAIPHGFGQAVDTMFTLVWYPVMPFVYLMFIAHAVPRRETQWLRTPVARQILTAAVPTTWLILAAVRPSERTVHDIMQPILLTVAMYGLVAAVLYRRKATGAVRRRATAYLAAFGSQDIGFVLGLGTIIVGQYGFNADPTLEGGHPAIVVGNHLIALGILSASILLTLALFRSQILDFQFKLHRGISRGTIAAIFVGLFFVVSELTATLLSERVGPVLGIAATGLLVFALAPLQRLGDRVGSSVVKDSRRLTDRNDSEIESVYRDHVAFALEDGHLTVSELRMLETIRGQLGLEAGRAQQLQSEAVSKLSA